MKNAIAHIGGTCKEDILVLPDMPEMDQRTNLFDDTPGGPSAAPKLSVESITTLEAIAKESPQLDNKYFRN